MGKLTIVFTAVTMVEAILSFGQTAGAYHIFLTGKPRVLVEAAIDGALRRLARPQCQQLLTDFTNAAGQPLVDALRAWGKSPGEALAALYFVEGDGSNQCRADETTGAFTAPDNRV